MTPEEMSAVTLGEFEAMAARFGAALNVLREAQALLGGTTHVAVPRAVAEQAVANPGPVQIQLVARETAMADDQKWREGLSIDQQNYLEANRAERNRLVAKIREG